MSATKCTICGKNMPPHILPAHMKKTHGTENPAESPAEATTPVEERMVTFTSHDGKKMVASINDDTWQGNVITVKESLAGEIKHLLRTGGYHFDTDYV